MDHAHYAKVTAHLHDLIAQLHDRLADRDRAVVEVYLGANELGLALDHMAYALAENDHPVSLAERADMLALAELMGMDDTVTRALDLCPSR